MAQETDGGIKARLLNDTIAGVGPGIPDDALASGKELLTPPREVEIGAIARTLDAPIPDAGEPT